MITIKIMSKKTTVMADVRTKPKVSKCSGEGIIYSVQIPMGKSRIPPFLSMASSTLEKHLFILK